MHDLPQLLEFEQGVIAVERPFAKNLKSGKITYYELEQLIADPNAELLVAELEGALIGSGYAEIRKSKPHFKHPYFSYLGFMYVDPGYRGMGVNKQLIEALMAWSKSRGVYEVSLDVYSENAAAIRAYEKAGFRKNLVQMCVELE
ncbi:GNAT family N-acetyltransferase [Exilibacterium tricleocarpae]|uniref:GNAT family N-acetyltransferase n=1 Tax=Exilibacterium tricleocarpae TaxID=2591008 RepID=A0A545SZ63_9GAMM|nr:GNAT family N-acetyltransferase [Exilibacterium tricleocarpae]